MANTIDALPDLQTLARALGGVVRDGQVLAAGPGHSPRDRSLSVKLDNGAPNGFVVNSFAGDDPITCRDYVRERLGLPGFKVNGANGRVRHRRASDDAVERALMAAVAEQKPKPFQIVATYNYTDSNGALLYQVLRLEPKDFRQRRPDGNGGWSWKLDVRRVVYRWPELLKYPDATIFVCEGEKDADRVVELGHCATCVAGGKWTDECVAALAGRDCVILEDNDDAGCEKALAAARVLHGTAKTIRIVSLPGLPERADVSDWLDIHPYNAKKLADICFDVPVWTPDQNVKAETASTDSKSETPPLAFIDIAAWHDQPVPEREWTVKDRIPANNVTLLSGEGSIGKSILSLQLAVAVVLGRDWLGTMPEFGPALVVCCEDDANELWRRLDLIAQHYGADFTKFQDMHLLALAGGETLMAAPDRNGIIKTMKLFERIHQAACDIKPKLIVLDNAADVYGGSENDRAQVRQFIGFLRGMAIASGAGILMTSHPSLTGINSGTGLSGSTAWNASVRSRLYFRRAVTDEGEQPDPNLRVLEVMKSNYGPIGETLELRWTNGLFLPVSGPGTLDKLATEQAADTLFLMLLDAFELQGRNISDKRTAPNYAPTLFAADPQAKTLFRARTALADAMARLFANGKSRVETYGRPSRQCTKLVRT